MSKEQWNIPLASYLDEAGEDPLSSCKNLKKFGIHYVFLRHVWAGNILKVSDANHAKLKSILKDNDISVIGIASELGKVNASKLSLITDEEIEQTANICRYYNASMVRVFVGEHDNHFTSDNIQEWLERVSKIFTSHGIKPLMEISPDSCFTNSITIADYLSKNKKWRLLYDPVNFILKKNIDPFVRHWTLLKQFVEAIDVRDLKIGSGFKPPGMGDSKIELTISDSIKNNHKHWFVMEPSLGRRHGQGRSKEDTFGFAIEGLKMILDEKPIGEV